MYIIVFIRYNSFVQPQRKKTDNILWPVGDRDTFVPRHLPEPPTGDDFSKILRESIFVDGEMDSGRSEITAF